jgi:hypothetical protein
MRRMSDFSRLPWGRKRAPRTVYVGSYEDKLSRLRPMGIDPDDDARTREDVDAQKAVEGRGNYGGGPVGLGQ